MTARILGDEVTFERKRVIKTRFLRRKNYGDLVKTTVYVTNHWQEETENLRPCGCDYCEKFENK